MDRQDERKESEGRKGGREYDIYIYFIDRVRRGIEDENSADYVSG